MKKGFTLTELLTIIVILGVLAAIALPRFSKTGDKTKARQAVAYLRLIRAGEQMYFAKNGQYVACAGKAALKTNLGVEVTTESYAFNVTTPTPTTFTATATRGTTTINYNQDGVFTGSNLPSGFTLPTS